MRRIQAIFCIVFLLFTNLVPYEHMVFANSTPLGKVHINKNFDDEKTALALMSIADKDNNFIHVYDEETENGYFLTEKTQKNDPHFDFKVKDAGRYVVFQSDVRMDKFGMLVRLFFMIDENNLRNNPVEILESGDIQLNNGNIVGKLTLGQWKNIAMIVDFEGAVYDVYLDGQRVAQGVGLPRPEFSKLSGVRMHLMSSNKSGYSIMFDNIKVYDGQEIRDIGDAKFTIENTVLKPDYMDAQRLNGTVALHINSDNIFIKDHREKLDAKPFIKNDIIMLPAKAVSEGLGFNWRKNGENITIGDDIKLKIGDKIMDVGGGKITLETAPEIVDGVVFVPMRVFCEQGLRKVALYHEYGLIVISDNEFEYAQDEAALQELGCYMFFNRPTPDEVLTTFQTYGKAGEHPRLIADKEKFDEVRSNYQNNDYIKQWTDGIINTADGLLTAPLTEYEKADGLRLSSSSKVMNILHNLGFAYQITGDGKYAQRAWEEIYNAGHYPDWNPGHFLCTVGMMTAVSVGYDLCYDAFTEEQRTFTEDTIFKYGIVEGLGFYYGFPKGSNFVAMRNNWSVVCNGGLTLGALAIMDSYPEVASLVISCAVKNSEWCIQDFAPEGAWLEGPGYWSYTMQYLTYFSEALTYSLGTDYDIANYTGVERTGEFMLNIVGNTGSNNFHDSGASVTTPYWTWLGKKFDNENFTAARMASFERNKSLNGGWQDILWYDTSVTSTKINLPLDLYTARVEAGSMRSSWEDKSGIYVGFHGGDTRTGHCHIDQGTFVLDMLGQRWAIDIGADNYNLPGYFSYAYNGARWKLYRMRAEGHNTIVINPDQYPEHDLDAFCPVIKRESKEKGAYQVLDMSDAFKGKVNSALRGYMVTDNRRTFIMRDEVDLAGNSEFYWFMHTRAEVEILDEKTAILTQGGEKMKFEFLSNVGTAQLSVMDAKPLPTSPDPDGQNPNTGIRKLAIYFNASGKVDVSVRITPYYENYADTEFTCDEIENWEIPDGEIETEPMNVLLDLAGSEVLTNGRELLPGEKIRIGFDLAAKEFQADKFIEARFNHHGKDLLRLGKTGDIYLFGERVASVYPETEKWYRFDVILTSGDETGNVPNTADLYVNGVAVKENFAFSANNSGVYERFRTVNSLKIGYSLQGLQTEDSAVDENGAYLNYKPEGMYLDNINYEFYTAQEAPSVSKITVASNNAQINELISPVHGIIKYGGADITAASFKQSLVTTGVLTAYVVDANGVQVSDSASIYGNIIKFITTNGDEIFYTASMSLSDETDFDEGVTSDGKIRANDSLNGSFTYEIEGHEILGVVALGGKPQHDTSVAIKTTDYNYAPDTAAPYLEYKTNSASHLTSTFELSAYLEGRDLQFQLEMPDISALFLFNKNGTITAGDEVVGIWEEGRWYRVAFTLYPNTPYIDLYLNGKFMKKLNIGSSEEVFDKIRLALNLSEGVSNGLLAIDDFKYYTGEYNGAGAFGETVSNSSGYIVSEQAKEIYTTERDTSSSLVSKVAFASSDITVYTDNSFNEKVNQADLMDDGNIVVLKSSDGLMFDYYKIKVMESIGTPFITIDGWKRYKVSEGTAGAEIYSNLPIGETAKLIFACYRHDVLEGIALEEITGGFKCTKAVYGNIEDADGISFKVIIISEGIRPLTKMVSIN